MKFLTAPTVFAAILLSVIVAVPFSPAAKRHAEWFVLEARLKTQTAGTAQLYFDTGNGFSEAQSTRTQIRTGVIATPHRFTLPPGNYTALRIDPLDRPGTMTIESLRVVARSGRVLRTFELTELKPAHQIRSLQLRDERLELATEPSANDAQLNLPLDPPLKVKPTRTEVITGSAPPAFATFFGLLVLLYALDRVPRLRNSATRCARWLRPQPATSIALTAGLMVILSAYPVLFLGKSLVSPNVGTTLLYDEYPTLPGYTSQEALDARGADVGAVMWQHVAYSMIQRRALAGGEMPLWNRYNAAGAPLLAQGQSMFGDPLHCLVVLCDGAAWAWDAKYLIAKWLFAVGLGLLVLAVNDQGTKGPRDQRTPESVASPFAPLSFGPLVPSASLLPALLVAASAPFIGFFVFRINHPAVFSVCYSVWILYAWVRAVQGTGIRATAAWAALLMLANWSVMHSGTAKEAYMLILALNFSGLCVLLASANPWRVRLGKLALLAWAGVLLILIATPWWASFLNTLRGAYTTYNTASAYQILPALALGFFDELFYRPLTPMNWVLNPSLNFLLLLGVLYFLATLRHHFADRLVMALAASALLPLALAFGLVPPSWIDRVPFLNNVAHVDNTFSCALLILGAVLAGVGFATARERLASPAGRGDLAIAGLLLFALVFAWIAFRQVAHKQAYWSVSPTASLLMPGKVIQVSPFIWGSLVALLLASGVLALSLRRTLRTGTLTPALGLLMATCATVMLWRHGLHARSVGFEDYIVRPMVRANFHAKSPAVDFMRAAVRTEPARGVGTRGNFHGGWTGAYGLETIYAADAVMSPHWRELAENIPGVERMWEWRLYVESQDVAEARPVLDALNVRYYFGQPIDQGALARSLRLVKTADLDVFESPTAWPRAFFTDRLAAYDKPEEFVAKIRAGDGRPFAAIQRSELATLPAAYQETMAVLPRELTGRSIAPATNYRLTENTTSFEVRASSRGAIVLSEVFWPGDFRVEVNGRKLPILRLNHAFKGVIVDGPGEYRVTFRYVPKNFPRSLALCGAGVALTLGSLGLAVWRDRRESRRDAPRMIAADARADKIESGLTPQ